jgi:imidazole glycerol-phosphate synthase subunit HisF
MERKMFYGANSLIFNRARELRNDMTHAEMVLWGYLKTKPNGYKFRRQHPLGIYIADFFCYRLKLVIEVDGRIHDESAVKLNDAERQRIIESDGITVLRFTNDEVMKQVEVVISKIQLFLNNSTFYSPLEVRGFTPL